jgi:hypothetical protein
LIAFGVFFFGVPITNLGIAEQEVLIHTEICQRKQSDENILAE